jgi:hypothetical protein
VVGEQDEELLEVVEQAGRTQVTHGQFVAGVLDSRSKRRAPGRELQWAAMVVCASGRPRRAPWRSPAVSAAITLDWVPASVRVPNRLVNARK